MMRVRRLWVRILYWQMIFCTKVYLYNQLVAELGYFELCTLIILLIKHKLETYQIKAFFKWCTFGPLTYF